jgi:hypothetical protein
MAAGDVFVNCTDRNLSLDALIRLTIKEDVNGNPAFTINTSSVLEPYINCEARRLLTTEQLLRMMIIEDDNGNPIFNIVQD